MDSGFGIGGYSKSVTEMTTSKLDYWSPLIVENGVKTAYNIELRPQSYSLDGPIEFYLAADPSKFIDITSCTLHGRVGIQVKVENEWVGLNTLDQTTADNIGIINNFFQSIFSSVIVKLNDLEIGDISNSSYPYLTYLQTLLGTSASQGANNILKQRCFIKDDYKHMKTPPSSVDEDDGGYHTRRKPFFENEFVDFNIPIHNDIATVEKYLPPNTKLTFTLRKSTDDFILWSKNATGGSNEYRVVLKDIHLKLKMMEVYDDVLKNHQKLWKESSQLRIKYTQNILKTFAVPKGNVELSHHNLFFGNRLPNRIYLAFVEQDAYNGDFRENPFNFEQADIREAYLSINGISQPSPPYIFEKGVNEKDMYFNFLENTGTSSFEMESVNVTFEEFKNGYFIIPFDRSPTKDNGLYTHKGEGGNITVKVKCKKALEKNYMVLVFASYDSALLFIEDKVITEQLY